MWTISSSFKGKYLCLYLEACGILQYLHPLLLLYTDEGTILSGIQNELHISFHVIWREGHWYILVFITL